MLYRFTVPFKTCPPGWKTTELLVEDVGESDEIETPEGEVEGAMDDCFVGVTVGLLVVGLVVG